MFCSILTSDLALLAAPCSLAVGFAETSSAKFLATSVEVGFHRKEGSQTTRMCTTNGVSALRRLRKRACADGQLAVSFARGELSRPSCQLTKGRVARGNDPTSTALSLLFLLSVCCAVSSSSTVKPMMVHQLTLRSILTPAQMKFRYLPEMPIVATQCLGGFLRRNALQRLRLSTNLRNWLSLFDAAPQIQVPPPSRRRSGAMMVVIRRAQRQPQPSGARCSDLIHPKSTSTMGASTLRFEPCRRFLAIRPKTSRLSEHCHCRSVALFRQPCHSRTQSSCCHSSEN